MSRSEPKPAAHATAKCVAIAGLAVAGILTAIFLSGGAGALLFLVALGLGALGGGPPKGDPSKDGSKSPYMGW